MSYCDLLERMMQKDTDAFLEMTNRYGWGLYSAIRKKYPNKADVDRIYDETMQYLFRCMQNPACEDPMEAILCAVADMIAEKNTLPADLSVRIGEDEDRHPNAPKDPRGTTGKRKGRFWFRLGMIFVVFGFAAVIWIGMGLLMEAGILPYYDLGFSWFAALAGRWI